LIRTDNLKINLELTTTSDKINKFRVIKIVKQTIYLICLLILWRILCSTM